ncbi:hypothetical protein P175DRAFT_0503811 [Aspergillus ochraceoroseus IBT 24754]|nr:uncharacterized protein P175DRAFT_0503811 [Aspergillus ochraceoroseus IBT 24754]PTU18993.1 hypothetical protein P175DRAFT_0503811 [Aspergillus ochraceoroseus IBT 24754]
MPFLLSQRASRRLSCLASFLFIVCFYALYHEHGINDRTYLSNVPSDCPHLPGLEHILVVLKTGVTEAQDKLPVHRNTTLRCIPNYIVWSDYEEEVAGIPVHDVLFNESQSLHSLPEFDLYTRVHTQGRESLTSTDLTDAASTPFGKPDNPGWVLDKWKFLPMIEHTFRRHSSAKWYVFMEADTYIVWPSLLAWLDKFDHTRPYYMGNQMQTSDVIFAHGGSGFVISRPAMERAVDLRAQKRDYWDNMTKSNWAGDCVLGLLLREAGIALEWSWPMLQLAPPKELDHFSPNYGRSPWCYPPLSFHHLRPEEIEELWSLDRRWTHKTSHLLYRDVFWQLAWPRMSENPVDDWDNLAGEERLIVSNIEQCREECKNDSECLQYSLREGDNMCRVGHGARLGEKKTGFKSAWLLDRINATAEKSGTCTDPEWIS